MKRSRCAISDVTTAVVCSTLNMSFIPGQG